MTSSYPTRRSIRLRDYDYSQPGAYFVTLCIEQRLPLLGKVVDGEVALSPAGEMVATVWQNLAVYYGVGIDAFVVMPNHLHGIVVLTAGEDNGTSMSASGGVGAPTMPPSRAMVCGADGDRSHVPTPGLSLSTGAERRDVQPPSLRPPAGRDKGSGLTPPGSLSTLILRFKTFTAHEYGRGVAAEAWPRYPGRLWQNRFHEHVIRNERDLYAIREYIVNNPLQWHLDRENPRQIGNRGRLA